MVIYMLPAEPKPNNTIEHTWEPNVEIIRFGDGYTQRYKQGIDAHLKTYTLKYSSLTADERNTIYNFITALGGAGAFGFRFLHEDFARAFICHEGITETEQPGMFFDLQFTMEEVKDIDTITDAPILEDDIPPGSSVVIPVKITRANYDAIPDPSIYQDIMFIIEDEGA